ncbi:MAG: hypothetical protein FWD75_06655 [Propionibacteriaceae bacterium]|nr:hypothetical protein [Propionibacteriaceae bacterium]
MITVIKYGVWHTWSRHIPDSVRDQLWLAHCAREDLVTTTLDYHDALKDIWSSFPEVAAAEQRIRDADDLLATLLDEQSKARQASQSKKVPTDLRQRLTQARASVRSAKQERRDAITTAGVIATPLIAQAKDAQYARRKELYTTYCTRGIPDRDGRIVRLYHATFNDVRTSHETAEKRISASRANGSPAQMRHHRFDETGTLAVSLLRQAGAPPRTPQVLADTETGKYRNVLAMPWFTPDAWAGKTRAQQRVDGRVTLRMRIGYADDLSSPTFVDLPVQAHRFFPPEADITGAKLTIQRRGTTFHATVSITGKGLPDPTPVTSGPAVVLHWGWREVDTDIVEVARWAADAPLHIPDDMGDVFTTDGSGTGGSILTPKTVFTRLNHVEKLQSEQGTAFSSAKNALVSWLSTHATPMGDPTSKQPQPLAPALVDAWRSPDRLARLAWLWRDDRPDGADDLTADLLAWRGAYRHTATLIANTRAKAISHRNDVYRNVAAVISGQAATVGLDSMDLATIAATSARSELSGDVTQPGARRRTYAAPGTLREYIAAACAKDGVTVSSLDSSHASRTHYECGHTNPRDTKWLNPIVRCDGCGESFDQNTNALHHLQARQRDLSLTA